MTFEQLIEIAKEQDTRIFNLDCLLVYMAKKEFSAHHFRQLRLKTIEQTCWEKLAVDVQSAITHNNRLIAMKTGCIRNRILFNVGFIQPVKGFMMPTGS